MIRLAILAFALGAAWLQTRPQLPDLALAWLLPLALLASVRLGQTWRRGALVLLALAAGFL